MRWSTACDSGDVEIDLVELFTDVGGLAALPVIVVGAGLPHLPAVLSASKSYSERLFRYTRIDQLGRAHADQAARGRLPAPLSRGPASRW